MALSKRRQEHLKQGAGILKLVVANLTTAPRNLNWRLSLGKVSAQAAIQLEQIRVLKLVQTLVPTLQGQGTLCGFV
jgi:hypothetical protein